MFVGRAWGRQVWDGVPRVCPDPGGREDAVRMHVHKGMYRHGGRVHAGQQNAKVQKCQNNANQNKLFKQNSVFLPQESSTTTQYNMDPEVHQLNKLLNNGKKCRPECQTLTKIQKLRDKLFLSIPVCLFFLLLFPVPPPSTTGSKIDQEKQERHGKRIERTQRHMCRQSGRQRHMQKGKSKERMRDTSGRQAKGRQRAMANGQMAKARLLMIYG